MGREAVHTTGKKKKNYDLTSTNYVCKQDAATSEDNLQHSFNVSTSNMFSYLPALKLSGLHNPRAQAQKRTGLVGAQFA